jgi:hypothetical protein
MCLASFYHKGGYPEPPGFNPAERGMATFTDLLPYHYGQFLWGCPFGFSENFLAFFIMNVTEALMQGRMFPTFNGK